MKIQTILLVALILIGGIIMGDWGIKVSKAGKDVKTAADDELVLSSKFNSFKIVDSGNLSLTLPDLSDPGPGNNTSTSGTAQYNHNLGYVPTVLVFMKSGSSNVYYPVSAGLIHSEAGINADGTVRWYENQYLSIYTTSTKLRIDLSSAIEQGTGGGSFPGGNYNFKFYLLRETAD